jgi:hypothetical protein
MERWKDTVEREIHHRKSEKKREKQEGSVPQSQRNNDLSNIPNAAINSFSRIYYTHSSCAYIWITQRASLQPYSGYPDLDSSFI